jgi:RpiR family carbohydrate utilization transcriptional regulator
MVPCVAYSDSHMQYMSAATLQPGDAVVAISHTGRTRELLQSVDAARQSGATLIAITAPGSPLAQRADVLIPIDVPEDTDLYTPMTSRIAHLLVIDVLALGVALRGDDRTAERLRRMKDLLRAKRLPKGRDE